MPFPKFEDINKSVKDLFKKEFFEKSKNDSQFKLEVKTDVPLKGVSLTSKSTLQKFSADESLSNNLTLEWAGINGFKLEKLEFNPSASAAFTTETSVTDFGVPGLKLEFKGNTVDKSDISLVYEHEQATVTAQIDASDLKSFNASVTSGANDFVFGASADKKKDRDAAFEVSAAFSAPKFFGGLNLKDGFKNVGTYFSFAVDNSVTIAANPEYNIDQKDFKLGVGLAYKCNKDTFIKTKVDLKKNFDLSVKQSIAKGFALSGWTRVTDGKIDSVAYGVKFTLG